MTTLYCDLCEKSLSSQTDLVMVQIGEFTTNCCEVCAKRLINKALIKALRNKEAKGDKRNR